MCECVCVHVCVCLCVSMCMCDTVCMCVDVHACMRHKKDKIDYLVNGNVFGLTCLT